MDSMRHAVHTVFKSAAEKVMPTRSESGFQKHGVRMFCCGEGCALSDLVATPTQTTAHCAGPDSRGVRDFW